VTAGVSSRQAVREQCAKGSPGSFESGCFESNLQAARKPPRDGKNKALIGKAGEEEARTGLWRPGQACGRCLNPSRCLNQVTSPISGR
jgi:hypothetical protein